MFRHPRGTILALLVAAVFAAGCASRGPESAVARYLGAVADQDNKARLDALDPALRERAPNLGMLEALSVEVGGLILNLSEVSAVSFADVRYRLDAQQGELAWVRTEGKLQVQLLGLELNFCDVVRVHRVADTWYVSPDDREEQIKRERIRARLGGVLRPDSRSRGAGRARLLDVCP